MLLVAVVAVAVAVAVVSDAIGDCVRSYNISDATVAETNLPGALDDEELFIIEGSAAPSSKNRPKLRRVLVEIMSRFRRANRAEETATRSIDCANFSIQTEWRTNASGFEFTAT